jgi:four helix bundle protein
LKISKGSAGETRNHIYIASAVAYISKEEFEKTNKDLEELAGQIGGFIHYLEEKRKNKEFVIR